MKACDCRTCKGELPDRVLGKCPFCPEPVTTRDNHAGRTRGRLLGTGAGPVADAVRYDLSKWEFAHASCVPAEGA